MAKFERGDVFVYHNVNRGDPRRNGALGVATGEIDSYKDPIIKWLLHPFGVTQVNCPFFENLQKIGHIDADAIAEVTDADAV